LPISNNSQVYTSIVETDTLNWANIQGSFVADSNYAYISIGNHYSDSNTTVQTMQAVTFGYNAYYFIDDVCVSADSATCFSPVGIKEVKNTDNFNLFPNPFSDKINITVKRNELIEVNLFDVTARKIFSQSFTTSTSINTEQLAKGIYLYEVRNKNGVIKKGKVVKE
jgi:hypothetical protein